LIIRGKAYWAKVIGAPGWGYKKQHKEWSIDVAIDEATKAQLIEAGVDSQYIKNKGDQHASGGDFVTFKRRDTKADGTPGKPIMVVDRNGQDWDGKTLIGNGSVVNVKIALNDRDGATTKKPGLIKMQVWELVEFEGREGDDEDFPVAGEAEEWS
jgi:hypothetical protein